MIQRAETNDSCASSHFRCSTTRKTVWLPIADGDFETLKNGILLLLANYIEPEQNNEMCVCVFPLN